METDLPNDGGFVGSQLLRYNKEQVYVCADLETEGLSLTHSRPWQLSFMVFTLDRILETHDYYIWWPDLQVSEDAKRVTRFNYDTYKYSAKPLEEVLPIFEKFYLDESVTLTGHNWAGYDSMVWNTARKTFSLPPIFNQSKRTIDTLALSRAYRLGVKPPKFTPGSLEWSKFTYKMLAEYGNKKLKTSLGSMAKNFEIPVDEMQTHNALYDIQLNISVFKKLLWALEI